jgi:hypothetical protein
LWSGSGFLDLVPYPRKSQSGRSPERPYLGHGGLQHKPFKPIWIILSMFGVKKKLFAFCSNVAVKGAELQIFIDFCVFAKRIPVFLSLFCTKKIVTDSSCVWALRSKTVPSNFLMKFLCLLTVFTYQIMLPLFLTWFCCRFI